MSPAAAGLNRTVVRSEAPGLARRGEANSRAQSSRRSGTGAGNPAAFGPAAVSSEELQSALLVVLVLFASMALLNFEGVLNAAFDYWRSFTDFLAGGMMDW